MHKKSTTLFLIFLGVIAILFGYSAGLMDWIQDYSSEADANEPIRSMAGTVAFLVYTYFGVRFFNRRVNSTHQAH